MPAHPPAIPAFDDILEARKRLQGVIQTTPLDFSKTYSDLSGNEVYLKLENLQKTGSFKIRGAYNKLAALSDEERRHGVIAASAGNHAQGVAYAARALGTTCTIVMPEHASLAKIAATQRYGAQVVLQGATYDDAYAHAVSLQQAHGYTYVHAFDDPQIIAGQGTLGVEILEQLPTANTVIVPMGGGGLAAGMALALKTLRPEIRVIGVQAAAAAGFRASLDAGEVTTVASASTIADGIAVRRPGTLTFALAQQYVDDVITVEEEEIARSMVFLMERSKLVAEGAAAAALAAVIYRKVPADLGQVVVLLSGGNVDVTVLSKIIEHGLAEAGRYLQLTLTLPDQPGALRGLLDVLADLGANVVTIQHDRLGVGIAFGQTRVQINLETRDKAHIASIFRALQERGYAYQPADAAP
ncbi:threonine ammonia-lyase [Alicyclobacillus cycloheptanicus]|uniref:L-threonine dehydratase catabolic TdcB n=1 Tax=Alicyclobacillus cycloheptanicus TaxID=1457 RepID=A0ABT9XD55_9BACL|nr:threonine ammonia-lyase [Alicyclobacillus cycloheptanicus]MDQ0188230.1 threonine dehydratase [Alicyclobacillus cycloheptanicus]WDM00958.1 threonine ammonia-lyase [Alicyclobacillus cycloheptanicus]